MAALVAFWGSLSVTAWAWLGYPAVAALAARRASAQRARGPARQMAGGLPGMSVIVAVHDEEHALPAKLRNCLDFDYPGSRFEIIVASDGSRDGSVAVARRFATEHGNVRFVESGARIGKSTVQNLAAAHANGEVLLFTDVDTVLHADALRVVASQFSRAGVGCVTGRVVWRARANPDRARSENLYWRFEHTLWEWETALGTLCWASGACLAVRRDLFRAIDPRYGDDVIVPFDVVEQGAAVRYEPALTAMEESPEEPGAALRARTRMTLRSLTATLNRRAVYSPRRRPGLFVAVASHKLLRWATPFLFLTVLGSAVPLAMAGYPAARIVAALQACGIVAAVIGHIAGRFGLRVALAGAAHDLAVENLGMLIGVAQAIARRRQLAFGQDRK